MSRIPRVRAVSVFSSKGGRPAQEDFVLNHQEKGIFVVADGFGGPVPGATASRTACEAVRGYLVKEAGDLDATMPFVLRSYFSLAGNVLFNALIHANRRVVAMNKGKSCMEKGGASVLAGFMDGDLIALANVGACSAWLFRGGRATELVVPRTYARLADPFAEDARDDHRVPLMAVGMSEDLEPEIFEYRVRPGDWLLIHTDGIGKSVREGLLAIHSLKKPANASLEEALAFLGKDAFQDNASLTLVAF